MKNKVIDYSIKDVNCFGYYRAMNKVAAALLNIKESKEYAVNVFRGFNNEELNAVYDVVDYIIKDIERTRKCDGFNARQVIVDDYIAKDIELTRECSRFNIRKVIFNGKATIVFWGDNTKTVVKCKEGDTYDPEKGLAMAITKKYFGNKGNYYNIIKKWLPENNKEEKNSDASET